MVVLYIILKFFMLFLGESFYTCIVNNRKFYAINKNKVSIIIWPPTVKFVNFTDSDIESVKFSILLIFNL